MKMKNYPFKKTKQNKNTKAALIFIKTMNEKTKTSQKNSALIRSSRGFWEETSSLFCYLCLGQCWWKFPGREERLSSSEPQSPANTPPPPPPPPPPLHPPPPPPGSPGLYVCHHWFSHDPQREAQGPKINAWGGVGWGGNLLCVHNIQKYPGVRSYLTFTTAQEPTKVQCTNKKTKQTKNKTKEL